MPVVGGQSAITKEGQHLSEKERELSECFRETDWQTSIDFITMHVSLSDHSCVYFESGICAHKSLEVNNWKRQCNIYSGFLICSFLGLFNELGDYLKSEVSYKYYWCNCTHRPCSESDRGHVSITSMQCHHPIASQVSLFFNAKSKHGLNHRLLVGRLENVSLHYFPHICHVSFITHT